MRDTSYGESKQIDGRPAFWSTLRLSARDDNNGATFWLVERYCKG